MNKRKKDFVFLHVSFYVFSLLLLANCYVALPSMSVLLFLTSLVCNAFPYCFWSDFFKVETLSL